MGISYHEVHQWVFRDYLSNDMVGRLNLMVPPQFSSTQDVDPHFVEVYFADSKVTEDVGQGWFLRYVST